MPTALGGVFEMALRVPTLHRNKGPRIQLGVDGTVQTLILFLNMQFNEMKTRFYG